MSVISATSTILEGLGRAQDDLLWFVRLTYPEFQAAEFHRELCHALERFERAVARRRSPRLMISLPPRHGKSFIASERFPAWFLGRDPRRKVIAASYGQELANTFSRRVRDLVRDEIVGTVFPGLGLRPGAESVQQWETSTGGAYRAAGVGAGITGQGADALIIDDPIKDAQEAGSETYRQRAWEWFTSTAYTRLMPGGGVLVIQTRWHQDDLAGRLLADGEPWEVLTFPAIDEAGRPLHPARYSAADLARIRSRIGEYYWSALYQQRPIAREDQPFRIDRLLRVDSHPMLPRLVAVADLAYSKSGDHTALVVGGPGEDNALHVVLSDERRVTPAERSEWFCSVMPGLKARGLTDLYVEGHPDAIESIRRDMIRIGCHIAVHALRHGGASKADRIFEIDGYLDVLRFGPAAESIIARLLEWSPVSGTPDDLPDALAYMCRVIHPMAPSPPEPAKLDRIEQRIQDALKGGRRPSVW